MAKYHYDKTGKLTGYTKTREERENEGIFGAVLIVGAILFAPIIGADILSYNYLVRNLHPVFASIILLVPNVLFLWGLIRVKGLRFFYFSALSILYGLVAGLIVTVKSDGIYGTTVGLLVAGIGVAISRAISR